MPKRRWSKRRVVSSGYVAIPPFYRFEAGGDAKSSMRALACVFPTMRIGMGGRGKAARHAGGFGGHGITDFTPGIPLIGPDIEAWGGVVGPKTIAPKKPRKKGF